MRLWLWFQMNTRQGRRSRKNDDSLKVINNSDIENMMLMLMVMKMMMTTMTTTTMMMTLYVCVKCVRWLRRWSGTVWWMSRRFSSECFWRSWHIATTRTNWSFCCVNFSTSSSLCRRRPPTRSSTTLLVQLFTSWLSLFRCLFIFCSVGLQTLKNRPDPFPGGIRD